MIKSKVVFPTDDEICTSEVGGMFGAISMSRGGLIKSIGLGGYLESCPSVLFCIAAVYITLQPHAVAAQLGHCLHVHISC